MSAARSHDDHLTAEQLVAFAQRLPSTGTIEISLDRIYIYIDAADVTWEPIGERTFSFTGSAVLYSESSAGHVDTIMIMNTTNVEWMRHTPLPFEGVIDRIERRDEDSS